MRVLIIPEDATLDQYVLKPVITRIFADLERPATRVDVLTDREITGVAHVLRPEVIAGVIADNRMIDLFLLIVDRDCKDHNVAQATARAQEHDGRLIATLAWQEVEVWPLALHRAELGAPWAAVRDECHPKETFFDPFIKAKGWGGEVGKGRKKAMRPLGQEWRGLLQVCPEIAELKLAIQRWLTARAAANAS